MWTPRRRPARPSGSFSQMTFTRPSVSPRMRARLLPPKGSRFVTISMPGVQGALLGHAHEGHLRVAVDGPGHLAVVDRDGPLAEDLLDDEDRLGEADVGQLRRRRRGRRRRTRPRPSCASTRPRVHSPARRARRRCPSASSPSESGRLPDRHDDRLDLELLAVAEARPRCGRRSARGRCTTTPVRTVIPRLVNDRTTTLATSWSQPGRIFGSASSKVTCTPRSDEHRGELAADRAAADHRRRLRELAAGRAPRRRSGRSGRPPRSRAASSAPSPTRARCCLPLSGLTAPSGAVTSTILPGSRRPTPVKIVVSCAASSGRRGPCRAGRRSGSCGPG